MRVLRPPQELSSLRGPSLFLAGPTPRSVDVESWRPQALDLIGAAGFVGDVLVPEVSGDERFHGDYDGQVLWEHAGLECCTLICFWVPRNLNTLPGFTTNVEFGRYITSGRVIYGRPENAAKTRYLDWHYRQQTGHSPFSSLPELISTACRLASQSAENH